MTQGEGKSDSQAPPARPADSSPKRARPHPGGPNRRWLAAAGLAVVTVAVVASISWYLGDEPRPADPAALNTYDPAIQEFFAAAPLGGEASAWARNEVYDTVEDAARSASVVLVGEVTDVAPGPIIGPGSDRIQAIDVVLRPVEVLSGKLPAEFQDQVTVVYPGETPMPSQVDEVVEELRATLPSGQSVWFLRSGAQMDARVSDYEKEIGHTPPPGVLEQRKESSRRYITVSLAAGVFAQGDQGVVNALPPMETHDPVPKWVSEGEQYAKLSELAENIRQVEGWHGKRPEPRIGG